MDANTPALGGEDPRYAVNTLAEGPEIYQGSYTTTSTYYFPTETVARWNRYVQEVSPTRGPESSTQVDGASGRIARGVILNVLVSVAASSFIAFMWLF